MEERFSPEESLLLITKTIEETKRRFEENGHIIILWGVITFVVFASQYIFSAIGWYKKFDIIWTTALFPVGMIYTFIYIKKTVKERNLPTTLLSRVLQTMGWTVGANFMIMGLLFGNQLGNAMAPVFIILLAFSMIVTGASIKFKPLFVGGILMNLIGLGSFLVGREYHGFSLMLGSVVGLIIPGILLNKARKENV